MKKRLKSHLRLWMDRCSSIFVWINVLVHSAYRGVSVILSSPLGGRL